MINKFYDIKINFDKPVQIPIMRFVQYDSKASGFRFSLDGITDLDVGHSLQIIFTGDYFEPIYDIATITSGSTAEYILKSDVLSKEGYFRALVSVLGPSDERLTSVVALSFEVIPSPDPDLIPVAEDDRLPVLTELISSVNQLDQLLKSNDSLRASAEASRVIAESNRNTAENQRISSEVYRQASEEDRQAEFDQIKTQFEAMSTEQTSNTEVIAARMDVDGVQHGSLKAHLDTWENSVKELSDKLSKEQSKPITVTDITTVDDAYGGPVDWCVKGATLNQAALNGNFASGTVGWTPIGITDFAVDSNVAKFTSTSINGRISQTNKIMSNRKYFVKARVKADSSNVQLSLSNLTNYGVAKNHSGSNKFEDLYFIADFTERDGNANGQIRVLDSRANGWTEIQIDKKIGIHYVDITDTFMESWTADQIANSIRDYWEGLAPVKSSILKSNGRNHLDFDNHVNWLLSNHQSAEINKDGSVSFDNRGYTSKRYTDVKFKPNTRYTFSFVGKNIGDSSVLVVYYTDGTNTLLIFNNVNYTLLKTTSSSGKTISSFTWSFANSGKATIKDFMIEEGVVANPVYNPYIKSEILTSLELHGLPNNVKDEYINYKGHNKVIRKVLEYKFKPSDFNQFSTTRTNFDNLRTILDFDVVKGLKLFTSFNDRNIIYEGYTLTDYATYDQDLPSNIGKMATNVNGALYLSIPKGLYSNLAEVQAGLSGKVIYLELSSPIIIEEKDFDKHNILLTGDGIITTEKGYNAFVVLGQNFNPVVEVKYDLNIFTAVDSIKDVLSETRKLVSFLLQVQDQHDALLLDHENRLSLIEGA